MEKLNTINHNIEVLQSEGQVYAVFIKGLTCPGSSSSYANPGRWICRGFVHSLEFKFVWFQALLTELCFLLVGTGWVVHSKEFLHRNGYLISLGTWNLYINVYHRHTCYIPHACMQRQNCEHLTLSIFTGTHTTHRKLYLFIYFATDKKDMPNFVFQALILELLPWTFAYRNLK